MKKIFLALILSINFLVCGCSYNIVMKDGYPTTKTIQKEFLGKHDWKTYVMPFHGSQFIMGSVNYLTVNEVIDVLRPKIIAMSDIDTFAQAMIIDPQTRLDTGDTITIRPYYREKNIVCFQFIFACDRKGEESKTADQRLIAKSYTEYNSDTGKIVRENIPHDEAQGKRVIFIKNNLDRVSGLPK